MNKFLKILLLLVIVLFVIWFVVSLIVRFSGERRTEGIAPRDVQQELSSDSAEADSQIVAGDAEFVEPTMNLRGMTENIEDDYQADPEFGACAYEAVSACLGAAINKKVLATGDLSVCDDFLTERTRESCRIAQSNQLARERFDVSYCEGLNDAQKLNCRSEVAAAKAVANKNIKECDDLGEQREVCVEAAAQRLAYETLDTSWCENLSEGQRIFCAENISIQIQEQNDLERIEADFAREQEVERQQLEQENAAVTAPNASAAEIEREN